MIRIKLKQLLWEHRKNVKELAKEVNIHYNTLYRLNRGDSNRVDLTVLETLCEYFQCQVSDLMEYDPNFIIERRIVTHQKTKKTKENEQSINPTQQ